MTLTGHRRLRLFNHLVGSGDRVAHSGSPAFRRPSNRAFLKDGLAAEGVDPCSTVARVTPGLACINRSSAARASSNGPNDYKRRLRYAKPMWRLAFLQRLC